MFYPDAPMLYHLVAEHGDYLDLFEPVMREILQESTTVTLSSLFMDSLILEGLQFIATYREELCIRVPATEDDYFYLPDEKIGHGTPLHQIHHPSRWVYCTLAEPTEEQLECLSFLRNKKSARSTVTY